MTNQPTHTIRLGRLQAAIWSNTTEKGVLHNVTFERRYNTEEGWKSSGSFGRDDLLIVAKLADLAHTWIASQKPASAKAEGEAVAA